MLFGARTAVSHELGPPATAERGAFFDAVTSKLALPPRPPPEQRRAPAPPPQVGPPLDTSQPCIVIFGVASFLGMMTRLHPFSGTYQSGHRPCIETCSGRSASSPGCSPFLAGMLSELLQRRRSPEHWYELFDELNSVWCMAAASSRAGSRCGCGGCGPAEGGGRGVRGVRGRRGNRAAAAHGAAGNCHEAALRPPLARARRARAP